MRSIDYIDVRARVLSTGADQFDKLIYDELPSLLSKPWVASYKEDQSQAEIVWIPQQSFEYLFDLKVERVLGVYGVMTGRHSGKRDSYRAQYPFWMRSDRAGYDVGHLVQHSSRGGNDINLFLQLSGVNRGAFRSLEREAVDKDGSFYFVRLVYAAGANSTDRPIKVEQGLVSPGPPTGFEVRSFAN